MSNNPISAENQQERLSPEWITGFTDGEGCFSVGVFKNESLKFGYQVFPEFVITQGAKSLKTLEDIQKFFGCGKIYENKRYDNHRESLYRYCVRSKTDLSEKIIPFFNENYLRTSKSEDFESFKMIISMIRDREHLTEKGFERIRKIASTMNRRKSRTIESPTTKRQTHHR
ncbi:LAGLIDADG family homing endonuclease [Christensenellaceae bacterium OttesenSCG-928-L17]|nr:LAGLIDADG family homing endonuclease [Christensenellaceae bacterium OttesenSCG-928-L17]